ncbi:MAG TPA: peptide deformylase [Gemmatimonadaceae bacterium]|nr:peptide deformylase [Gemmatimonadaceae bacterium]
MSLLGIHVLGSPVLRAVTTPVPQVTDAMQQLIDDMFETMYAAQGIGLAAPQVGRLERVAVVDVEKNPIVIVNPEIVLQDQDTARAEEGCLSIPDIYGDVVRPGRVVVRALDRQGKPFEVEGTDLLGRALQHEIDHLHGKLFIDYLSFLKRRAALAKWEGMKDKYPGLLRKLPLSAADEAHEDEIL